MKRVASPGSMHDTGCLGLVHWDDLEGWNGEGGGRRVHPGESSRPRIEPASVTFLALAGGFFSTSATCEDVTLLLFKLPCRWFLQPQQTPAGPLVRLAKSYRVVGPARGQGRGQRVSEGEWAQPFQKVTGRV